MYKASGLYWVFQLIGWGGFGIILLIVIYTLDPEGLEPKTILYIVEMVVLFITLSHLQRAIFIKYNCSI